MSVVLCTLLHWYENNILSLSLSGTEFIIIISAIVSPLLDECFPKLVPFTSVLCRSHPCHTSKLYNIFSPSSFLSFLTSRTCQWSPFCCYVCPSVVLSSGEVSRPSPLLDFNLFCGILDFSLLFDPFANFLYLSW